MCRVRYLTSAAVIDIFTKNPWNFVLFWEGEPLPHYFPLACNCGIFLPLSVTDPFKKAGGEHEGNHAC